MKWEVDLHDDFVPEFDELPIEVQDNLLAHIELLKQFGPHLARPQAHTLRDSRYANMKELRFDAADGVWRVAFAFDAARKAIILVAGDKSGGGERRFYRQLIDKADERFGAHLAKSKKKGDKQTMTNLDRIMKGLSPERRKKIEARAAQLIAEELTLQKLRRARKLTQVRMAKALGIGQDGVSKLEKRTDLMISTLRKSIQAMGGNLSLVAEFPDRDPVVLAGIGEVDPVTTKRKSKKKAA